MGKTHSKAKILEEKVLADLERDSYIPKKTINAMYAIFMKRHTDGQMTETDFLKTYVKCVPSGNPDTFRTFAFCSSKEIGFSEFLLAVKMSSLGDAIANKSAVKQTIIEVIGCLSENYYDLFYSTVKTLVKQNIIPEHWVTALDEARQKSVKGIDLQTDILAFWKMDIFDNVRKFLVGEMSGENCLSTVLNGLEEAFSFAGENVGRIVGTLIAVKLPIGVEILAIFSAVAGKISAQILTKFIKKWISEMRNKDIENAYALFNTSASASDSKIESSYRKRSRKYDPDKGGDVIKWIQIQHAIALIRDARSKAK